MLLGLHADTQRSAGFRKCLSILGTCFKEMNEQCFRTKKSIFSHLDGVDFVGWSLAGVSRDRKAEIPSRFEFRSVNLRWR